MLGKGHYKQNKIKGKYLQYNTDKGLIYHIYIYLTLKIEDQKNKKQQKNVKSWINNSAHKQRNKQKMKLLLNIWKDIQTYSYLKKCRWKQH